MKWLTEAEDTPFTSTTVETGEKSFEYSTYTQFDCKPNVDYPEVTIPSPIKSYEAAESEAVQQVGVEISHRPGVNLGR